MNRSSSFVKDPCFVTVLAFQPRLVTPASPTPLLEVSADLGDPECVGAQCCSVYKLRDGSHTKLLQPNLPKLDYAVYVVGFLGFGSLLILLSYLGDPPLWGAWYKTV